MYVCASKTLSFFSRKHTLQYVQYIRYKAQQDNAYLCLEIVHFSQRMDVLHIGLRCYSSSSLKDKWASLLEMSAFSIGSTGIGQDGSEQSFLQKRTVPSCRSDVPSFSTINVCDFAQIVKKCKISTLYSSQPYLSRTIGTAFKLSITIPHITH